jgi:hypothetical protein
MIVIVTILLTVDKVGALFQIAPPPPTVLACAIVAGIITSSWYGVGKVLANSRLLTSWTADQSHSTYRSN